MDEHIAPDSELIGEAGLVDRGSALKHWGLIFLGGFAAAAVTEAPVEAIPPPPVDHPPWGIDFFAAGIEVHAGGTPPALPTRYPNAQYFGIVIKDAAEHGLPSLRDLAALGIPVPAIPGLAMLAAYKIPASSGPGFANTLHPVGVPPTSAGTTILKGGYDVYLLVYGQP